MAAKPLAFVLMPFEEDFDAVYTSLIEKPLAEVGFEVRRADSLQNQRSILHDIVQGIAKADLIVVDVSGLNGNVMYELGLAHGLGKRTVLITRSIQELPFDLRPYRAHPYTTKFTEAHKLAEMLGDLGEAVLNGEADFSNPVQDFAPDALVSDAQILPTQETNAKAIEREESASADDAGPEDSGFLELLIAMQEGDERVGEVGNEIAEAIGRVNTTVEEQSKKVDNAVKNLGDRAVSVVLQIAKDVARELEAYSDTVEPLNGQLEMAMRSVTRGADAIARNSSVQDLEDLQQMEDTDRRLSFLEEGMRDTAESVSGFAQVMTEFPNMESSLKKATRRAGLLTAELAATIDTAQAEFARARSIMAERIADARHRLS